MAEEKVVEKVKMTDGRTVEFSGKRKMQKTSIVMDDGALAIQIDFRNGETRTFVLEPSLKDKFALHGAEQKYGDEVSGVEDIDDMVLAVDDLHSRLEKGEWSVKREANGISGSSILLQALVEFSGKSIEDLKPWLSAKTPAQKADLRKSKNLFPIVQRLEAEKAAKSTKKVNEADLFEGL